MTTAQRIKLMSHWWPAACRAQGWAASDRELRLRALALCVAREHWSVIEFREALECIEPLASASELNTTTDMDAVIRTLGLLADDLAAGMDNAEMGARRRLCHKLSGYPLAYVAKLARDKFGTDDLDTLRSPQLQQLVMTLSQRRPAAAAVECPF